MPGRFRALCMGAVCVLTILELSAGDVASSSSKFLAARNLAGTSLRRGVMTLRGGGAVELFEIKVRPTAA